MTLTGQCSKDFNEWYLSQDFSKQGQYEYGQRKALNMFNAMMLPFRWGVYVDFFAVNEIYIEITFDKPTKLELMKWWVDINNVEVVDNDNSEFDTLNNARLTAIKHSNEIYNAQ